MSAQTATIDFQRRSNRTSATKAKHFQREPADFQTRVNFINADIDAPRQRIRANEKEVYRALCRYVKNGKQKGATLLWWTLPTSIDQIQAETGYHRVTVSKAISRLKAHGFIDYKNAPQRKKRYYHVYAWSAEHKRRPSAQTERPEKVTPIRDYQKSAAPEDVRFERQPESHSPGATEMLPRDYRNVAPGLQNAEIEQAENPVTAQVSGVSSDAGLEEVLEDDKDPPPTSPHEAEIHQTWSNRKKRKEQEEGFIRNLREAKDGAMAMFGIDEETFSEAITYTIVKNPLIADFPTFFIKHPVGKDQFQESLRRIRIEREKQESFLKKLDTDKDARIERQENLSPDHPSFSSSDNPSVEQAERSQPQTATASGGVRGGRRDDQEAKPPPRGNPAPLSSDMAALFKRNGASKWEQLQAAKAEKADVIREKAKSRPGLVLDVAPGRTIPVANLIDVRFERLGGGIL